MLRDWGHVIAVEAGENQIFVMLQFFVGPGAILPAWIVASAADRVEDIQGPSVLIGGCRDDLQDAGPVTRASIVGTRGPSECP